MEFNEKPLKLPLTKFTSITRNLSTNPLRPAFKPFKSINDFYKTDLKKDLNKKYFGDNSKDIRSDSLTDLMSNEFKSIKQLSIKLSSNGVSKRYSVRDQSVQTDICQFAKLRLSSNLCETASNYMQFAEEFIEEIESEYSQNSMDFPLFKRENDFNSKFHPFSCYKSLEEKSFNNSLNYRMYETNENSDQTNKFCIHSTTDLEVNKFPRLILDSNVVVYEAVNCQDYELGEEAFQMQFKDFHINTKIDSNFHSTSKQRFSH